MYIQELLQISSQYMHIDIGKTDELPEKQLISDEEQTKDIFTVLLL